MKIAIVYSSVTGNTEELAKLLEVRLRSLGDVSCVCIKDFPLSDLSQYDGLIIGTYTLGDGEVPFEMVPLLQEFLQSPREHLVTGIFGTGDSFYPKYCGAVDVFRDVLKETSNLAVTLKVELMPQLEDLIRCDKFVEKFAERLRLPVC